MPAPQQATHLAGARPGTTLCGVAIHAGSSWIVAAKPRCDSCRALIWADYRARATDAFEAGSQEKAESIMAAAKGIVGEPYPLLAMPAPRAAPPALPSRCPACHEPALRRHCDSPTCGAWKCPKCLSFGRGDRSARSMFA